MKFSWLALSLFVGSAYVSTADAQTGAVDTAKKQTPVYSIRNPRVLMENENKKRIDNANITFATQFAGAYAVAQGPDVDTRLLRNVQQLTFGGENLAPSFSPDGKRIVFEARSLDDVTCRQIFSMDLNGQDVRRISTGKGEALDGTFSSKGDRVLFTSTHANLDGACPPVTDHEIRWRIPVYGMYDIYVSDTLGKDIKPMTADGKFYDGMPAISPDNRKIVFSSTRQGDVDLYLLELQKNEIMQLTASEGFDGMAKFSPDGKRIVFSASRPIGSDVNRYRATLINGNVNVDAAELYIMDLDGSNVQQLTANGARNVNASFSPNGEYLIFASNMHDTTRNDMAIYTLRLSNNQVVQQVNSAASEDYPVWSADGKKVAYVSTRKIKNRFERNIYVADWGM
jgi:TolB protein